MGNMSNWYLVVGVLVGMIIGAVITLGSIYILAVLSSKRGRQLLNTSAKYCVGFCSVLIVSLVLLSLTKKETVNALSHDEKFEQFKLENNIGKIELLDTYDQGVIDMVIGMYNSGYTTDEIRSIALYDYNIETCSSIIEEARAAREALRDSNELEYTP